MESLSKYFLRAFLSVLPTARTRFSSAELSAQVGWTGAVFAAKSTYVDAIVCVIF